MTAQNGALSWWPNRKSMMGLRAVVAKAPPKLPDGREWWCEPPTSQPEPAHIEYVAAFQRELLAKNDPGKAHAALVKHVADWMRAARRLLHERMGGRTGSDCYSTATTDDVIVACKDALHACLSIIHRAGMDGDVPERVRDLTNLLSGRADAIKRRRAVDPAHPVRRPEARR